MSASPHGVARSGSGGDHSENAFSEVDEANLKSRSPFTELNWTKRIYQPVERGDPFYSTICGYRIEYIDS